MNLTNDDDSTSPSPGSVWSDPKVKLLNNEKTIRTRHSTRALCHFLKIRGNHIAICKAVIPSNWLERYCSMRKRSTHLISAHKRVNVDQEEFVSGRQEAASVLMVKSKKKSND